MAQRTTAAFSVKRARLSPGGNNPQLPDCLFGKGNSGVTGMNTLLRNRDMPFAVRNVLRDGNPGYIAFVRRS